MREFPAERRAREALANDLFDIVHIFRLDTLDHARKWIPETASECWLDLDDVESATHRGIAELHRTLGDQDNAERELTVATTSERAEIEVLRTFDRVFLASAFDLERLPTGGPARIEILPNVLPLPDLLPNPPEVGPFVFLFVGTLGYFPNWEGLSWLIGSVWPAVRQRAQRPAEFHIVGHWATGELERFALEPGIHLVGPVDDVRSAYECAHAVVVPLRAGGGTRIKIIEAFGYRRPVITTSIGVEGIEAVADRDVKIADDAPSFAGAMLQLIDDASLRDRLADNAHALMQDRYTDRQLDAIVQRL